MSEALQQQVDIVLAHYNGSAFIGEQIQSIKNNKLPPNTQFRLLIVDDGSRPEEFAHLQKLCAESPEIVLLKNEKNSGVIKTFERALMGTTANYIMLCDQDDVWLPNKIQISLEKIQQVEDDSPAMVFTELCTVDAHLKVINERMLDLKDFDQDRDKYRLLFQNYVTGCTVIMNRKLLDIALPFPLGMTMHDHWLAICAAFSGKLAYIGEPTIWYRQHSSNMVGQPKRQLRDRATRPLKTIREFDRSLARKSVQTAQLASRLKDQADKAILAKVAEAFRTRTAPNLRVLLRTQVFGSGTVSLFFVCALYLLPSKLRSEDQPSN